LSSRRRSLRAPLDVEFRGLIEQARIVGSATYEGDLAPFWPFLVFGQWAHVGRGATFGLGGYRLEAMK
jgi:CRISPR/Cas system endoribonuclease Cas6 (RAMP superfamily)